MNYDSGLMRQCDGPDASKKNDDVHYDADRLGEQYDDDDGDEVGETGAEFF